MPVLKAVKENIIAGQSPGQSLKLQVIKKVGVHLQQDVSRKDEAGNSEARKGGQL
jgi:hypothetical protein